jgi:uncharacterized protein YjbJ (UPF0337 family)
LEFTWDLELGIWDFQRKIGPLTSDLRPAGPRLVSMKSSTKDKIKGRVEQAKGVAKEKAGRATGNRDLQDRGTADKVKGTVRNKIGDVKKVFGS